MNYSRLSPLVNIVPENYDCKYVKVGIPGLQGHSNSDDDKHIVLNNCSKSKIEHLYKMFTIRWLNKVTVEALSNCPRLEKICADERNHFLDSFGQSYRLNMSKAPSDNGFHEAINDFKYLIDYSGFYLMALNIEEYPYSEIMPLINKNCSNLRELILQFKEIESQDFENVFCNMSYLEVLRINWQCKNLTLPLTLVKSIEQVGGTLKELCLSRDQRQNHLCLPDSMVSIFPQLITLETLNIINFEPSKLMLESINEIKNLVHLKLMCSWLNNHSELVNQINTYRIGRLQPLETLSINYDCGVTNEFLINVCVNSYQLKHLDIIGKNITDDVMLFFNNLRKLKSLKLNLNGLIENEFITDLSIQRLVLKKLKYLDLSNCKKITNRSLIELLKNLPNLEHLHVRNTSITFEVAKEVLPVLESLKLKDESLKLRDGYFATTDLFEIQKQFLERPECFKRPFGPAKNRPKKPVFVYVSFKDHDDIFKSLALLNYHFKSNFNTHKYIDIII